MPALGRVLVAACCVLAAAGSPAPPARGPELLLAARSGSHCKCIPGDKCWPKAEEWSKLNSTTKGKLTATMPLASMCHEPNYDAALCSKLKEVWKRPETHLEQPESFFAPYFQNGTCDPFGPQTAPCVLGNYASYAITIKGPEEVKAAFEFAKKHNVRLSIKNTGHDFLGKSSGKGSVVLWTHKLKDATFIPAYKGSTYSGPAVKLGAGLLTSEAYLFAKEHGVQIAGSSCASVGIAGGYTSGGGHNPLMGTYGMAADNALEWEVVTPKGEHVIARPEGAHKELYWAMSGGGGGTWGVVLSVTVQAHPDGLIGGGSMAIPAAGLAPDVFWDVVHEFYTTIPAVLDTGAYVTALLTRDALVVAAVTAPNMTADQVADMFKPFRTYLAARNVSHTQDWTAYNNFYDHMSHYFGPYPYGAFAVSQLTGGRLGHKEIWTTQGGTRRLVDSLRKITSTGRWYFGMNMFDLSSTATARAAARPDLRAVMPAWRDSRVHMVMVGDWDYTIPQDQMRARHAEQAEVMLPELRRGTGPGRGIYLNEGNFAEKEWQEEFYGANYPRLSHIKKTYDPDSLLYARTAVGSERWAQDADGRLCSV